MHFTARRFPEAETKLGELLADPRLDPPSQIALRIIEIGSLAAQSKDAVIPEKLQTLRTLVANQPAAFTLEWSFEGTKHFIGQHEALAFSRDWLLGLIQGFEGQNQAMMLVPVDGAHSNFVAATSGSAK